MKQIFYNRFTNLKIRNIALGLVLIALNSVMFYFVYRTKEVGIEISIYVILLLILIINIILVVLSFVLSPFGQVIESENNKDIVTYFMVGGFKFKKINWGKANKVALEQDERRFYNLIIYMADGRSLSVEKYPVLSQANKKLEELKELIN